MRSPYFDTRKDRPNFRQRFHPWLQNDIGGLSFADAAYNIKPSTGNKGLLEWINHCASDLMFAFSTQNKLPQALFSVSSEHLEHTFPKIADEVGRHWIQI